MRQKHLSTIIALGVALAFIVLIGLSICVTEALSAMAGIRAHEKYIYPVVRITHGPWGGSGTVIYSEIDTEQKSKYSTYVLTNHHVIAQAIRIEEKWDSDLAKEVKKEKRSIVYVELFKYRNLSTPVGTLKVEADIVIYNADEDMALIKLRAEEEAQYVAKLMGGGSDSGLDIVYNVMDETVAVGCSLGFPPLPTVGHITRKDFQLDSLPFDMSSSQIIYGNSGGAMFLAETGELIGIPSMLAVIGWNTPITHMGLFIPIERIYKWLETEHYDFIYDASKNEKECLELREKEIETKKKEAK